MYVCDDGDVLFCTVQYSIHQPHMITEYCHVALVKEELDFRFY